MDLDAQFTALDTDRDGLVEAKAVVNLLRTASNLPDAVLAKVWAQGNPLNAKSFDRATFTNLMRLAAQARQNSAGAIVMPQPVRGQQAPLTTPGAMATTTTTTAATTGATSLQISAAERTKYSDIFATLAPVNGFATGDKIKQVLLGSKLATPKLEKIWALADVDKDGKMDIEEFSIAMKLSFALINNDIQDLPAVLPAELIPAKTTAVAAGSVSPPFAVSPLPGQAVPAEVSWATTPTDREKFTSVFQKVTNGRPRMTESEARDIFIQSKLAVSEFAQIWTLCLGHKQAGSIDFGSFCVFMHLVNARRRGIALPSTMPVQLKELLPVDVNGTGSLKGSPIGTPIRSQSPDLFSFSAVSASSSPVAQVDPSALERLRKEIDEENARLESALQLQKDVEEQLAEVLAKNKQLDIDRAQIQAKIEAENATLLSQEALLKESAQTLAQATAAIAILETKKVDLSKQLQ